MDLFFTAARQDPSRNGLILPAAGPGMLGASARGAFQEEHTWIFLSSFFHKLKGVIN